MRYSVKVVLFCILGVILLQFPAKGQVQDGSPLPAGAITSFSNFPVNELNRAYRQQRSGQFEDALLTYNSTLAFQPDWVPALTARAELLYRLGRQLEAERDHLAALRTNPTATAFFLARGRNGLLPFLALYPHDWYAENYGFDEAIDQTDDISTPEAFFAYQHLRVMGSSDTAQAVQFLRDKIDQNVGAANRLLRDLPRNYNPSVKFMLEGNLALLNHNYDAAKELYTKAHDRNGANWPEIRYNRGLTYILMHKYVDGCTDLRRSAEDGFTPAATMYRSLCDL